MKRFSWKKDTTDWDTIEYNRILDMYDMYKLPAHIKESLDESMSPVWPGSPVEPEGEPLSEEDRLYQLGYNDGHDPSRIGDIDLFDDPNYYLGYLDGKGDLQREVAEPFPLSVPSDIADIHNVINDIMNLRKKA